MSENGKLKWSITINEQRRDISDWILSDLFNGAAFEESVTIIPAIGGKSTINLPYTFPEGTTGKYTITYETEAQKSLGQNQAINKAILTPPGSDVTPVIVEAWGDIEGGGKFIPLQKTADISDASNLNKDNNGNITLPWTLTIDTTEGILPAGWKLYDELENKQWYTAEQLNSFMNQFKNLNYTWIAYPLRSNGEKGTAVTTLTDSEKYKAIELTFTNALPKGNNFVVKYTSTAPISLDSTIYFYNKATINGGFESRPRIIYTQTGTPTIAKYDATFEGNVSATTQHNIPDDATALTASWFIDLTIPGGYSGTGISIDETTAILDKGLLLDSLYYSIDGKPEVTIKKSDESTAKTDIIYNQKTPTSTIHIRIPDAFLKNNSDNAQIIRFRVVFSFTDDVSWEQNTNDGIETTSLKNDVQLLEHGRKFDQASQTQIFTRNIVEPTILKSAGEVQNNVIPYKLVINPYEKDLLPESDTLTLYDVIEFDESYNGTITLVPGSVHIFHRKSDGSQGDELNADKYTQIYSESSTNSVTKIYKRELTLTIPDKTALIVTYDYVVSGIVGDKTKAFINTATLQGVSAKDTSSNTSTSFTIQSSSAGANIEGVTLFKVDSNNTALGLPGAEFVLYKFDGENYEPVKNSDAEIKVFTTTSGNTVALNGTVVLNDLAYNTAYKLEEIKALEGYLLDKTPYYFYLYNPDSTNYPECKPKDFTGEQKYAGSTIYRPNTKSTTSITIQKEWKNTQGESQNIISGSIQIQIKQRLQNDPSWRNFGDRVTIAYTDSQQWTQTIDNLPISDDNKNPYEYSVEEIPVDGYRATYDNNDGITSGIITITNTKIQTYALPETGGSGTFKYLVSGITLCLVAILMYIRRMYISTRSH